MSGLFNDRFGLSVGWCVMNIIRIGTEERNICIDTENILCIHAAYTDPLHYGSLPCYSFKVTVKYRNDPIVIGIENATREACNELRERLITAWKEQLPFPIEVDGVYSR